MAVGESEAVCMYAVVGRCVGGCWLLALLRSVEQKSRQNRRHNLVLYTS